jgi:hypothetical protein
MAKIALSRVRSWKLPYRVTQDHINRGVGQDCGRCPQALAIAEALPGWRVQVTSLVAELTWTGANYKQHNVPLSLEAGRFVLAFDADGPDAAHPADFELLLPFDPHGG